MDDGIRVKAIEGPMEGHEWRFDQHDVYLFGREDDCHCQVRDDDAVSRHHFLLDVNPPTARIRDLDSRNGTYVNDDRLGDGCEPFRDLQNGDRIRAGNTTLLVEISAVPDTHVDVDVDLDVDVETPDTATVVRIPSFVVLRELGRGGMGIVSLARRADGLEVALKLLAPEVRLTTKYQRAFLRECQLATQLSHPNVVRHYDHGVSGGWIWCALEYCNGGSAEDLRLREGGRLTLSQAAPLILQSLDGLIYAHRAEVTAETLDGPRVVRGLVHRDLKPENILLSGEPGRWMAKVADYGLAKAFEVAGMSGMTLSDEMAGTAPFMAREQVTHFRDVKPISDVWAIAATFYHLLTGFYPRDLVAHEHWALGILEKPVVPIRERDPGLPADVAAVIDHALHDDPEERFESCAALHSELLRVL